MERSLKILTYATTVTKCVGAEVLSGFLGLAVTLAVAVSTVFHIVCLLLGKVFSSFSMLLDCLVGCPWSRCWFLLFVMCRRWLFADLTG